MNDEHPASRDRPFVSVVVPAYDEAAVIGDCLESLVDQTYPDDRYEVVVVDNGSADDTPTVVGEYPVTLVSAPDGWQFAARNAGIDQARGEVLAFTDADVTVAGDWIESGVRALARTEDPAAVYGKTVPDVPESPSLYAKYDTVRSFGGDRNQTWNLFTTRAVFDAVGRFDDRYVSGGDIEWADRAAERGVHVRHDDAVEASHPPRDSWSSLYGMHVRRGYGAGQRLLLDHPERTATLLLKEPLRLFDWYLLVARTLSAGSEWVDATRVELLGFAALSLPLGLALAAGRVRGLTSGSGARRVGDYR